MKIKYIGNFNDGTDWAKASTYNALALDSAGYDVYCEEVKYNQVNKVINNKITELTLKKSDSYDVVIQHVLPKDYKYFGGIKNIGFVEIETQKFSNLTWIKNFEMMDEIFVPNYHSQMALKNASSKLEPEVFPHSFDFEKVANCNKSVNIPELNGTFNFLFVGEFSVRKNLEALLIAFHNEFNYVEPVNLYIKTFGDKRTIEEYCNNVKIGMKKSSRYKKEIIINEYLEDEALWSTMSQCHAFVMPSRGEAWCYPAMDAMALGIPLIFTDEIGISDYGMGLPVNSNLSPCYKANDTFQDLYTSNDLWCEINIYKLQEAMRQIYNSYINWNRGYENSYELLKNKCVEKAAKYDYRNNELVKGLL